MSELKPCLLCGGTNTVFREHTYWTGQRNKITAVSIYHWCDNESPFTELTVKLKDKTHEDVSELWNSAMNTQPDLKSVIDEVRDMYYEDIPTHLGGTAKMVFLDEVLAILEKKI